MNEEDKIVEAAKSLADKIDNGTRTTRQCAIYAYLQGVEDKASVKVSSVWHDVSELPKKGEPVIVMTTKKHRMKLTSNCDGQKYQKFCQSNNIAKWAYRDELISL